MKTNCKKGNKENIHPPRWAQRFLAWYCRASLLEDLEGDLNEYFDRNLRMKGARYARMIYMIDVLKFFRSYTVRKPDFLSIQIHYLMIGSYVRTSRRSLVRNKLFAFINIIGLAVSMSVGLLVIAFLADVHAYDDFQEKKDRIYRVITHQQGGTGVGMDLASTSVKVGRKLRETIPGVEDFTIIRSGFSGDAHIGESTFPLEAKWADQSFFKVFTFPLVAGDPASALKEPYSLVLTEETARKLFADADPMGQTVRFDTLDYMVTGIAKDVPHLSHLRFDALISFASADATQGKTDQYFYDWDSIWSNYVYLTLPEGESPASVQRALDRLSAEENKALRDQQVTVSLQPLKEVTLGNHMSNNIGPATSPLTVWTLVGLASVIILSACFNYTNLSIARSLRRSREVGMRKVMGAQKSHVLGQFMAESVIVALLALLISFGLYYLFLRKEFLALGPDISQLVTLDLSVRSVLCFVVFAVVTGLAAGFLPAMFLSRISAVTVMKDTSGLKIFKRVGLRKTLIVVQYALSLIFIATTMIGYGQYKDFLNFDLGFTTENVLNIKLQGTDAAVLKKELAELPEIREISQSMMITSVGSAYGASMKYQPGDSAMVWQNMVDEHYLPVHKHNLLAGANFTLRPEKGKESEVIVNQQVLKRFNIAGQDAQKALGHFVTVDGQKLAIVGVLKDFHYGTVENKIEPVIFRYAGSQPRGYLNLKIASQDQDATLAKIENVWKKFDKVHPLEARFYNTQIEKAYSQFSIMIKMIGFVAVLAICIASLGLLGMVVFTIETRLNEISIRKVLGASETELVYLLCRGFLLLLAIAAVIALPLTYLFFDKIILTRFAYHQPIDLRDLLGGSVLVMLLAFLMIGSQTMKAARNNPAKVLKSK